MLLVSTTSAQPVSTETIRLRFYWGGGEQHSWSGRLAAPGGRLSDLQRLNVGPLAAATLYEIDGEVRLQPGPKTTHNAFDATLTRGEAQRIRIEMQTHSGAVQTYEIPIEQLLAGQFSATLPGAAGQLVVHRLVADQLRLRLERDRLILPPGEKLPLTIEAVLADVAPLSPLDLTVEVQQGRGGPVVSSQTHRLEAPLSGAATLATELSLPEDEGVYSIRIAAVRPPGLTTRFLPRSTGRVLVERRFQAVVFDPQRRSRLRDQRELLAEIDPTSPRWWERVPRWAWPRRLPRPERQIGSSPLEVVAGIDGKELVRLGPVDASRGGAWQAYPLPVAGAGRPHLVEVEYPADQPQTLTLSLIDRDATGRNTQLGAGESIFVNDWADKDAQPTTRTVRRLYWPRTQQPLLVLSNHQAGAARFGKIRVYKLQQETQPAAPASERLGTPSPDAPLVALCLTAPRLADAVGASLGLGTEGRVAVDDWQTWYEAAGRLADLVEQGGYNGAVVTVASSQGVAYPSRFYPAVPGVDRQPLASSTTDLPRKDLLKLLLLEFDRRGLRLVPAMVFDAALLPQKGGTHGGVDEPVYHLLDGPSADAARGAVEELVDLCRAHASFAGVAVDLGAGGAAGYAVLPVDETPTDPHLDRFLTAANLNWPEGVPRDAEAKRIAVSGPWRAPWNRWRADRLTEFYASLERVVRGSRADHRLFLLTHGLPRHPSLQGYVVPSLDAGIDLADLLLGVGIDRDRLLAAGPTAIATREAVGGREIAIESTSRRFNELNDSPNAGGAPSGSVMISRQPISRRLAPPRPNDRIVGAAPPITCVNTPSNAAALYAGSLHASPSADAGVGGLFEGGAAVSLLLDEEAITLRRRIANAKQSGLATDRAIVASSPLRVRSSVVDGQTLIELMNPLPWPLDATLTVEAGGACSGGWTDQEASRFGAGQHAIARRLPPHGIATARFEGDPLKVAGVRSTVDPVARQKLAKRLQDLKQRDMNVFSHYRAAENLSFEETDGSQQPLGWEALAGAGQILLTDREPKAGNFALQVECPTGADRKATLQTKPLPAPRTGQLALTFHLRPEGVASDTRVIIRFEEVGGDYVSSTTLDAERLGGSLLEQPDTPSDERGWRRPYAFAASDLPIAGDKPIRIVFEFRGSGRISIDDLKLYDLVFPLDLGAQSTRQKLALLKIIREAESALESDKLAECHRILDGYWPRFLQAYTPLLPEAPPEAVADAETQAEENTPAEQQEPAETAAGWRSYLPRFWR